MILTTSTLRRATAIASLAALLGAAPVPAPRFPVASATNFGVVKLVGESDGDAVVGGVQIFVAAGLDRETSAQSGLAALVAECLARTPVTLAGSSTPLPLRTAIMAAGGSFTYTVDGRSVHFYVEAGASSLGSALDLFSKALAQPDFSPATVADARKAVTARATEAEGNALTVGIEMFRRSYYASGAGMPALGSATTLANLGSKDVAAFYAANYKRGALSASSVGASSPGLAAHISALIASVPAGDSSAADDRAKPIPVQAPRIVAQRDVGAPWVVVGFAAPQPSAKDFGAMLVLESLLSTAFERDSTTTLGFVEKSVGAFYLYDSTPASLVFYVNGSQVEPSLALRELLVIARSLSQRPLGAAALERYKVAAEGHFLNDSVSLSDRSYLLGTFSAQGLGNDAMNAAYDALQHTTAADVQRVSKKYLQRYIVALVLPRQSPAAP